MALTQPKVSIIIPVYGVECYIEKCTRSLFEQTLEELEYIFVDDCSPDKSVEVLQQVMTQERMQEEIIPEETKVEEIIPAVAMEEETPEETKVEIPLAAMPKNSKT